MVQGILILWSLAVALTKRFHQLASSGSHFDLCHGVDVWKDGDGKKWLADISI